MKHRHNCLFVILGASGDLARKKLIPAIYTMLKNKELLNFAVIGIAREQVSVRDLLSRSREHIKNIESKVWRTLENRFYYFRADFYDGPRYRELQRFAKGVEKKHRLSGNRLFYLATLPQHFGTITGSLNRHGLAVQRRNWSRVVFEKPFGDDLKSARKLNRCIKSVFKEDQVYRMDHYLGKELVQNISVLRFTNNVFEPLWNRDYIDHVQVLLSEDFGVKGRGGFYDRYGALKDVIQNHVLQLLSLVAMEKPKRLDEKCIRDEKVKVLRSIRTVLSRDIVLGQYSKYKEEKGVRKGSKTETFAALKVFVDNNRWKGVPFYLMAGKRMKRKLTSIYIQFKKPECLLFREVCEFKPNHLIINIQPEEGFYLQLNAKSPGSTSILPVKMDFCHKCTFGSNTPEAYETLLMSVVHGDRSAFIRSDEIEAEWKIIDSMKRKRLDVHKYAAGSHPKKADGLIRKDGRSWHLAPKSIHK